MTHVALYCRLSPRPDGTYEGVDAQERWGRAYAAKTWPGLPVEVYADRGISAANGDHRPEFSRLREAITGGLVAHLWTVEQTRLERTETGWFALAAELDAAGITEVHTDRDGIVRVRDEVAGIKAVLAAGEVRKLTARVNATLAEKAAQGQPPGAHVFGYRHATVDGVKTYVIVPEQADVVREAADRVLHGWSLTNIATDLDARGVRGTHGGRINATTVKTWLTSPSIAGHRVYRGRIVGRGNWPPILDEDTWQAVRAALTGPRTVKTHRGEQQVTAGQLRPPAGRRYLLTGGLAVCGVCGSPLGGSVRKLGPRSKGKTPFLACKTSACVGVVLEPVEAYVLDRLWAELDKPEFLGQFTSDDHTARRDEITGRLSGLDAQRASLAAMWGAGELTDIEWQAARRTITETEQALRAELAAIPRPVKNLDIAAVRRAWPVLSLDEQRAFIREFVARVTVTPAGGRKLPVDGRVTVEWREV